MMKRIVFLNLALALALSSCSARGRQAQEGSGGTGPGPELFDGKIEGEISVSAYDTLRCRAFLEEAAQAFEAEHPGTKINVETFSAMPEIRTGGTGNQQNVMVLMQDDPQGRADYVSRVNTSLMSGTGADLYALDVLPLQKFVRNGTLENLEPYMTGDPAFKREDYRQNILEALSYQGGTWFLPLDYTFIYIAYDAALVPSSAAARFGLGTVWNTGELFAIGEGLYNGRNKLFSATFSGMGEQLLNERMQDFVDLENKRANFTGGEFTALLNSLQGYGDKGYIPLDPGRQDPEEMMRQAALQETDRYFFKLEGNFALFSHFTRGTGIQMRMAEGIRSARSVDDDDEIAGIAANADGSVPLSYSTAFGINARSKNKALSWAFLKFLLSKESQLSTNLHPNTLPLHNQARAEKAELRFFSSPAGQRALSGQMRERMEQYNAAVEALSDKINRFTVRDSAIDDMIKAEMRYFLNGSRSAEEVARGLQNKADLYLNE
ncbi:MAG: extracellular solute-binding protein [Treponema sp.]|jgi:multiple sugar transport system substrate-binding protein|nr:extracellular solute-binding protein [Treponema sp.]